MKKIKIFITALYLNNIILTTIIGFIIYSIIRKIDDYSMFYNITIPVIIIWIICFLVLAILNLISSLKLFYKEDLNSFDKSVRLLKLFTIPFFILNFILLGSLTIGFVAISHGFGIFFIPVPFIITYCILIVTSFYSILYILLLWKKNKINNTEFLIIFILQFCFILDIISIIYLLKKIKLLNIKGQNASEKA